MGNDGKAENAPKLNDNNTVKFLTSNSVVSESNFGSDSKFSSNYFRFSSNLIDSKYGTLNAKPMININKKSEVSPQLRLTASSAPLKCKVGDVGFKANLEDRLTFKFNNKLQQQDITNSARLNLKTEYKNSSFYVAPRIDCSQASPNPSFSGFVIGLQQNLSKKVSLYTEGYTTKKAISGDFKNTTYAAGVIVKL